MHAPLVSVIIPTFNRAALLQEAVASACRQSYPHLEILVIDDGSQDHTVDVMRVLCTQDDRVRLLRQKNAGVSAARNHGIRESQGDFIAFLDSDDLWKPWKVELELSVFRAFSDIGMVWTDMEAIDSRGRVIHPRYLRRMYSNYQRLGPGGPFEESLPLHDLLPDVQGVPGNPQVSAGNIYRHMIRGNLVHTSTAMGRRERYVKVGPFNEKYRRGGEDYDFHLRTCRLGPVAFVDTASIGYRIGVADQLTVGTNGVEMATAFLESVSRELAAHR